MSLWYFEYSGWLKHKHIIHVSATQRSCCLGSPGGKKMRIRAATERSQLGCSMPISQPETKEQIPTMAVGALCGAEAFGPSPCHSRQQLHRY